MTGFGYLSVCLLAIVGCKYANACDIFSVADCYMDAPPEDHCGIMECLIKKLEDCDQATLESIMGKGTTIESLEAQYALGCQGSEDCDVMAAAQCMMGGDESQSEPLDMSDMCGDMKCMISKLEGCDETQLQQMNMTSAQIDSMKQSLPHMGC